MTLRPYQVDAVARFKARADKRLLLAHATSAGKTRTALECARVMGAKSILVVCPAMARGTWVRELQKWAPEYEPHSIRFGRTRGLTKAETLARDAAYAAPVQIVSFKLLKGLHAEPRDLCIVDEFHNLRSPLSVQSKTTKALFKAHPNMAALGLSATPIPTEVFQLWNPLDTFWPRAWGLPSTSGDVSWEFKRRYCQFFENEYGVYYRGSKSPEALAELGRKLAPYMHRVTDAEVAPYLPPIESTPLWLDERRSAADVSAEWVDGCREETTHCAVVCYNRELAHDLAAHLGTEYLLTGEQSAEVRQNVIDAAKASPRAVVIATSESIRESISLSFCKRVLIHQWRSSPVQALQLMGRFRRQDADITQRIKIEYVVQPGEEARAEMLAERLTAINDAIKGDDANKLIQSALGPRMLTQEDEKRLMGKLFENFNADFADWTDDDEA